jgi:flagellar biosynthesis protein FliR
MTTSLQLDKILSGHVFAFLFVFARLGSVLMLLPGFGETYVSARLRMMLALSLSFLLMGPMLPVIPALPPDLSGLMRVFGYEIVIGLFFGSLIRLFMSVLETIGFVIALQTGLSNAVVLNPALATQSPLPSAFLSVVGVTLVFTTGLDHFLLRSLMATYDLFPPGGVLQPGDMAKSYTQAFSRSFLVGIELASPFMVIGLLMYVALGIMQRLMPQVQLFLVALPIQIWGGLVLLAVTISTMMTLWLRYFDQSVGAIFGR